MMLSLDDVSIGYPGNSVLQHISLTIGKGVTCLLGPNGAGKTTLFKSMLGLLPITSGTIQLLGRPLPNWSRRELARAVGYVPQAHAALFPFTALDMVVMGRSPHLPPYAAPSRADTDLARQSLNRLNLLHLAPRAYTELSGGERQLVLIARALAQEPEILIMDEPTASLDYGNQMRVLDHIGTLSDSGMAVVLSTHHPDHALRLGHCVALVAQGRLHAIGEPQVILTPANIHAVYGVDAVIGTLPGAATPSIAQKAKEPHHGA